MKFTPKRIREARERCENASDGPWQVQDSCSWRRIGQAPPHEYRDGNVLSPRVDNDGHPNLTVERDDLDFIAHSRTDLPDALDDLEETRRALRELNAAASVFTSFIRNIPQDQGGAIGHMGLMSDVLRLKSASEKARAALGEEVRDE